MANLAKEKKMLLRSTLFIIPLLNISFFHQVIAADSDSHHCIVAPEHLGFEPFPFDFNPCWHDDFPGGTFWPDGVDFLRHIADQAHQDRIKPSLRANIRAALIRAQRRVFQNPQYVVHSCYYYQHPTIPLYNRWIHNFLIPLCATESSLPSAFCVAQNVFPFQKRTVLDIGQAILLLRIGCNKAKEKLHDILTLRWPLFCAKYPCKRPLWLLMPTEEAHAMQMPDKNVKALLKLSDYLCGAPLEVDCLASPIRRLGDNMPLLRSGGPAGISYEEALSLLDYYNAAYNADGEASPISLGSDDEELFLREAEEHQ